MLNYAVYGGTAGQYPLDKVLNFDFGLGFVPVVQPPYSFNIAHVYPTSKIEKVVNLAYDNWNEKYAPALWNLIDWLYLIDPNAYVKNFQTRVSTDQPIHFPGKIFFKR